MSNIKMTMEKIALKTGELILLFLYSPGEYNEINEPIIGRTRLTKLLFDFIEGRYSDFKKDGVTLRDETLNSFIAWKFGPMSKDILSDLEFLIKIGFIESKIINGYGELEEVEYMANFYNELEIGNGDGEVEISVDSYSLSKIGISYVEQKIRPLLSDNQKSVLQIIKKFFNTSSLSKILDYIYNEYPKYTTNSIIREKHLKQN